MKTYVKPASKVLCTFGGGSIDHNGARRDVQDALDELKCTVHWEGGIPPNPEYSRLMEIVEVAKTFKPDLILSVGGGSVLDGTKFIACAAGIDEGIDMWDVIQRRATYSGNALALADVITLPATGSEWNAGFVTSRRETGEKLGCMVPPHSFPKFSLIDPAYTMTLPVRQLRNGVFDAMTHCLESLLTGEQQPMTDHGLQAVVRELVEIGPEVVTPGSSLELHERLIVAASYALNGFVLLGKRGCGAVHALGHQLTARYGIDHGATLAICAKPWWELEMNAREATLAEAAEAIFDVADGSQAGKAQAFLDKLQAFIVQLELPTKVSEWKETPITIQADDVEWLTQAVLKSARGGPMGWQGSLTEEKIRAVFKVVVA